MKVLLVTGSRSDWGLLRPVAQALRSDPAFELEIVATGSHLADAFGATVGEITCDGFAVTHRVDLQLAGDAPADIAQATARGLAGFARLLAIHRPDWVLLLGDRYEIFAAAQACLLLGVPIAHIAGGDVTEGAIDDAMRHAITKMASLHLVAHADAARVVVQLGEDPARVHCVGNPGLDRLAAEPPPDRQEMREAGYAVGVSDLLLLLHPETAGADTDAATAGMADAVTEAIDRFAPDGAVWLVLPNADAHGRALSAQLRAWAAGRVNVHVFESLPRRWFLGLMTHCRAMVGNSSSALAEAPSLGLPAVDVGARQAGRLAGDSVVHAPAQSGAIVRALAQACALKGRSFCNPYGQGGASGRIVAALKAAGEPRALLRKRFHRIAVDARGVTPC
jgi:UDP-hydrolysing UDP-N-acetyl-D-glucosamine 2-epimerase